MIQRRGLAATSLFLAAVALSACSSSTTAPAAPTESSGEAGHSGGVHWSYSGEDGPDSWGSLSPAFAACDTGTTQSPIAIENPTPVKKPAPTAKYLPNNAELVNNGHTVQALPGPGNTFTVENEEFTLVQMHFHTPGENTIDGRQYPGEAHFVHESADGKTAVLGVMFEEGAENPAWQGFIDSAVSLGDGATDITQLDWAQMIPQNLQSIRFAGSLTTPECTEGLAWFVATHPVTLSAAQLDALNGIFGDNARPVQPLNGRAVTIDK